MREISWRLLTTSWFYLSLFIDQEHVSFSSILDKLSWLITCYDTDLYSRLLSGGRNEARTFDISKKEHSFNTLMMSLFQYIVYSHVIYNRNCEYFI